MLHIHRGDAGAVPGTQAADLVKLYGVTAPALPSFIRGCAGANVAGILPVNISYSYLR